VKQN